MKVKELEARVMQIYAYTVFVGTIVSSIVLGALLDAASATLSLLLMMFVMGLLMTGIFSLPNVFIITLGLKYIYKTAKNEGEKRQYLFYLWAILCVIPVWIFIAVLMEETFFTNLQNSLLLLPYLISSLYFVFRINHKYDKIYPPDFIGNKITSEDLLDDDL